MKVNNNFATSNKSSTIRKHTVFKNRLFQLLLGLIILILFIFIFFALANIVWKGIAGLANSIASPEIQFAIKLSLFTSFTSTVICVVLAIPVAYGLERYSFPGHRLVSVVLNIPLSLPPLVCGVALLLLFGTTGFGQFLAERGLRFIFSVNGIILAQFFIIIPYMVRILKSTIADINPRLEFVARTLGCTQWQAFYKITLPLAKNGIIAGLVISWARAIGEFGCSLMVAGATRMITETLPVALYLNMSIGDLQMAMASATVLIIISLISLLVFEMAGGKQHAASRIS
ncbi:MAG: ABC transporter permease [Syntrophomonadaceae bacterium]|nr:ABC transporter permease [Syntrophomonadaceae bacterium]